MQRKRRLTIAQQLKLLDGVMCRTEANVTVYFKTLEAAEKFATWCTECHLHVDGPYEFPKVNTDGDGETEWGFMLMDEAHLYAYSLAKADA